MKQLFVLLFVLTASYTSFGQSAAHFGKEINDKKAIAASDLPQTMGAKEELNAKVTGTVESVLPG